MPSDKDDDKNDDTKDEGQIFATFKIPPFWASRPDLWFLQVETQFRLKGIRTNNTKYDYLVSVLPTETMEIVADILMNPPEEDKYLALKNALISRCQDSEERRLDSLLNKIDIGDMKPSELFRQMEILAGDFSLVNKQLLYKLWIDKLPQSVKTCVIAIESVQTQDQVFTIADKIHNSESQKVFSIKSSNNDDLKNVLSQISSRLDKFEASLCQINKGHSSRSDSTQPQSRNRSASRSRNRRNVSEKPLCWYHFRFGENAKKCIQPCKFVSKPNSNENDNSSKN